jgi:hypothetical protein
MCAKNNPGMVESKSGMKESIRCFGVGVLFQFEQFTLSFGYRYAV